MRLALSPLRQKVLGSVLGFLDLLGWSLLESSSQFMIGDFKLPVGVNVSVCSFSLYVSPVMDG